MSRFNVGLSVAVLVSVALSLAMVSRLAVSGDPVLTFNADLGANDAPPAADVSSGVTISTDGYVLNPGARGAVTLNVPLATTPHGRQILRLWAYSRPGAATRAELLDGQRTVRDLGRPGSWIGRRFDTTEAARAAGGRLRLRVSASNDSANQVLFFDKLEVIRGDEASRTGAGTGLFCAWIVSLALVVLLLVRAPRGDLLLIVPVGVLAAITWPHVRADAYAPLGSELESLWSGARASGVHSLGDGLAGQLLSAAVPLVGDGAAGARAATLLVALLALAAVWWAGGRVAGLGGSLVATIGLLVIDGFRAVALDDPEAACLILTGALYVGALHRVLGRRDPGSYGWLAAASALAALAEPLLLPGLVLVLLLVAGLGMSREHRLRAFGLTAIVLALGMALYVVGDHTLSADAGAALDRAHDETAAIAQRRESGLFGLIALVAILAGAAFTLCVPALRWLLVAPVAVAAPVLFLVDRGTGTTFDAAAFWLPALLMGAAVLVYAVAGILRETARPLIARAWRLRS